MATIELSLDEIELRANAAIAAGIRGDRMGTHWTDPGDAYFAALDPERVLAFIACVRLMRESITENHIYGNDSEGWLIRAEIPLARAYGDMRRAGE